MSDLRTPKQGRRSQPLRWVLRAAGLVLGGPVFAGAILLTCALLTINVAQACPSKETSIHQMTHNAAQLATRHVAATYAGAGASSAAGTAIREGFFGCGVLGHCNGACCAGSCCPACTAGLTAVGWIDVQNVIFRVAGLLTQAPLSSTDSDTQFRPPRTFL